MYQKYEPVELGRMVKEIFDLDIRFKNGRGINKQMTKNRFIKRDFLLTCFTKFYTVIEPGIPVLYHQRHNLQRFAILHPDNDLINQPIGKSF